MCLVPINLGNMHWIAAVINFKQKRMEYFDSMGDYGDGMDDVFYVSTPQSCTWKLFTDSDSIWTNTSWMNTKTRKRNHTICLIGNMFMLPYVPSP